MYIRTRKTILHLIGSFFAYTAGCRTHAGALKGRTRRRITSRGAGRAEV
nr:MAG TPA: hypothetical protein [Caudoviricetes sp.]